jgi:hypothetical protein
MSKSFKFNPDNTKQDNKQTKLKAKEQGKQTKQFWRNVASQQHKDTI